MFLTARRPNLVTGRTEEEAGRGDHVVGSMVLKVMRVEEKEVRKVAPALKQAWEWVRKALVGKESRTAAKYREAETTFLQLRGILPCVAQLIDVFSCVAQISHLLQLQGYYIISWLLLNQILNFHVLQNIHSFHYSVVTPSTGILLCKTKCGVYQDDNESDIYTYILIQKIFALVNLPRICIKG